jgi:hypothetical protein
MDQKLVIAGEERKAEAKEDGRGPSRPSALGYGLSTS